MRLLGTARSPFPTDGLPSSPVKTHLMGTDFAGPKPPSHPWIHHVADGPPRASRQRRAPGGDAPSAAIAAPDVAVVCPAAFRKRLTLAAIPRGEGHRLTLVSNAGSADDIRRRIRQVAKTGSLRFVVLVGSVSRGAAYDPTAAANGPLGAIDHASMVPGLPSSAWTWAGKNTAGQASSATRERIVNGVPTHYADARVNVLWGSERTIATDNWYAQGEEASDQRPAPTLAVGRLTAENPAELRGLVAKILDYERCRDFGPGGSG